MSRWWWPWRRRVQTNHEAQAAKATAEAKLRAARRDWPEVYRARDRFTWLLEQAMRRE